MTMTRRLILSALFLLGIGGMAFGGEAKGQASAPDAIDKTETLITRAVAREQPIEGQEYYVHTFVLNLVGLNSPGQRQKGRGSPVYQIVHTSEGPYDGIEAPARLNQIAAEGLKIGTHFWPLSSVQRVEIRF